MVIRYKSLICWQSWRYQKWERNRAHILRFNFSNALPFKAYLPACHTLLLNRWRFIIPVSEYRALRSRAARNIWYLCLNLCLRCSYRFISICSSNKTFRGPYKFTWRVFTLKATEISFNINNVLQISFDNFTKFQPIFFL